MDGECVHVRYEFAGPVGAVNESRPSWTGDLFGCQVQRDFADGRTANRLGRTGDAVEQYYCVIAGAWEGVVGCLHPICEGSVRKMTPVGEVRRRSAQRDGCLGKEAWSRGPACLQTTLLAWKRVQTQDAD